MYPFRDINAVNQYSWFSWQHSNYGGSSSKRTPSKSSHTFDDKPGCSKRFDLSPRLSTKLFLEYRGTGDKHVRETVKSTSMRVGCAFVSATCGFVAIISLSSVSVLTYKRVTRLRLRKKKKGKLFVVLVWILSISPVTPPFFAWNRFISMESGVSCYPDCRIFQVAANVSYIVFLVVCGFVVPLCSIWFSFIMVYR